MQSFKINKIKVLTIMLIVETILLFIVLTLCYNLYFHFTDTKMMIDVIINSCQYLYNSIIELMNIVIAYVQIGVIEIAEVFNNRELALGFWIIVFIFYAISVKGVRKTIPGILKTMFNIKLIYWYLSMIIYFTCMILILKYIGFWELRQLKDTIIWFLVVGMISSFRATEKGKDIHYYISFVKDNIKFLVLLQFISNMHSFSFLFEVVLIFTVTCFSFLVVMIDYFPVLQNKGGHIMKKFSNFILIIIGILLIYHSTKLMLLSFNQLVVIDIIKDIILPLILSFMFVLYIYLFAVITAYEVLFIRLSFMKTIDESLRSKLKFRVFLFCNLNILRISHFIKRSEIMKVYIKKTDDISNLFRNYKNHSIRKNIQDDSNIS